MRSFTFAAAILGALLVQNELYAQGILYTAPGVDLTYGVGYDVGSGVQIGYGYGVGLALSPQQLMMTSQGPIQAPLNLFETSPFDTGYGYGWVPSFDPPAKKAKPAAKANKVVFQAAKPLANVKKAK